MKKMLADGCSVDGAATVLGWHKRRVTARQRILELPEAAQTLVGSGEIPVAGIDPDTVAPSPAPAAPAGGDATLERLERLAALKAQGLLTHTEFAEQKRRILGE